MLQIKKRNGNLVPYDKNKIINAINNAMIDVDGILYETDTAEDIAEDIKSMLTVSEKAGREPSSVEQIQDLIEDFLMRSERRDVAKAYIRYRYKREAARSHEATFISAIGEKLEARNVQNQNANVDEHSFGGRIGEASSVMTKKYALDYIISKKSRENHLNNEIYIHDLDSYAVGEHNCLTIPIDKLAAEGCIVRGSKMIRPCSSFATFGQLSAVWMQLQSLQQFGGVSYSHYDWSSVPYVRKSFKKHFKDGLKYFYNEDEYVWHENDKEFLPIDSHEYKYFAKGYKYAMDMTEREVYQTVEALFHNLNTLLSRSGNQLPFSSINFGTCTLPEGRMVIKAILEISIAGIGELHTTSIFPCSIFQCMKGVNRAPGDPNYDLFQLALKSTAQRLYPNYANVDWSGNAGYDRNDPRTYFSTMGLVILAHVKSFELRPQV